APSPAHACDTRPTRGFGRQDRPSGSHRQEARPGPRACLNTWKDVPMHTILIKRAEQLATDARALHETAAREQRSLTGDEQQRFDDLMRQATEAASAAERDRDLRQQLAAFAGDGEFRA